MTLVIKSECIDVKDGACTKVCPVDCIYEGERMFYIHPDECIECAVCESICPVAAIVFDDEIPADEAAFIALNRQFFDGKGERNNAPAPLEGGWRNGLTGKDPKAIATWKQDKKGEDENG